MRARPAYTYRGFRRNALLRTLKSTWDGVTPHGYAPVFAKGKSYPRQSVREMERRATEERFAVVKKITIAEAKAQVEITPAVQ